MTTSKCLPSCALALFFSLFFQLATAIAQTAGALDPSFGNAGKVIESIGTGSDVALAVATQPDGKIVAAGESFAGDRTACLVVRLLPDGSQDPGFGQNGIFLYSMPSRSFQVFGMILQPDNKILVSGYIIDDESLAVDGFILRLLPTGAIDPDFGVDGIARIGLFDRLVRLQALHVLPNGKILAAGQTFGQASGGSLEGLVLQLLPDGTRDSSFAGTGAAILPLSASTDLLNALHVLPNGDILVTGYGRGITTQPTFNEAVALRLRPNGSLDTGYGLAGMATYTIPNTNIVTFSSLLLPNDKLVLGGYASSATGRDLFLLQLLPNGAIDISFANNGTIIQDVGGNSETIRSLALQPDGKIVGAGYLIPPGASWSSLLVRYQANGAADPSFGAGGILTGFYPAVEQSFYHLQLQPNGQLLTAGYLHAGLGDDLTVSRFSADGIPDAQFGPSATGFQQINIPSGESFVQDIALDAAGNIFTANTAYGDNDDMFLTKHLPGGPPDPGFGINGVSRLQIQPLARDQAQALAIQADGKILLAGQFTQFGPLAITDSLIVWRCNPDGSLDPGFGQNGHVRFALPDLNDIGFYDISLQTDGKILLCGRFLSETFQQFNSLLIRLLPDGSLDPDWGLDGIFLISNPTNTQAFSILQLPNGKVFVAGLVDGISANDVMLARFNASGAPDPAFGSAGVLTIPRNDSNDVAFDLYAYPDGRVLVAATSTESGSGDHFLEAWRLLPNGAFDPAFGTNGRAQVPAGYFITNNFSAVFQHASLDVQSDGKILLSGTYSADGLSSDILLARLLPDGTPDTDFGVDGQARTDIFGFRDYASGVQVQADGKILVGGFADNGFHFDAVLLRFLPGLVISAKDLSPDNTALYVYPNPLRETARLQLEQIQAGAVQVYLETIRGERLKTLFSGHVEAGTQTLELHLGEELAAGVYVCRVVNGSGQAAVRIVRQ